MKEKNPRSPAAGRPPKFNELRKPVTVTLPHRILELLEEVDADRARAIVRVTEATVGTGRAEQGHVELVEIGSEQCVLLIGQSQLLCKIPWLKLVEIAPARNLVIIQSGTPIEMLEVALSDLIETATSNSREARMLNELRLLVSGLRREKKISKGEIIFFSTQPTARRKQGSPG